MRCPKCKNQILQKSGSKTRLRTHGPIDFEDGLCKAKCYWCKEEFEIELELSEPKSKKEALIIRQRKIRYR